MKKPRPRSIESENSGRIAVKPVRRDVIAGRSDLAGRQLQAIRGKNKIGRRSGDDPPHRQSRSLAARQAAMVGAHGAAIGGDDGFGRERRSTERQHRRRGGLGRDKGDAHLD